MKAEQDIKNQQRCPRCNRIVGCNYKGRKLMCDCGKRGDGMKKVWIVCDNNVNPPIRVFESLEKAKKYIDKYDGFKSEDCWIFNEGGSEIE